MGKFTGEIRNRPWLPDVAVDLLKEMIKPKWQILETGAGASTIWMAKRATRILSFEHNEAWADGVNKKIEQERELNLANHQMGIPPHCGVKIIYDPGYPAEGLKEGIESAEIEEFDMALIDGRGRVKSIMTAIPFLKRGGWLVFDNANRPRYEKAVLYLARLGWPTFFILGKIMPENKRGYTQFWRKP